MMKVNARLGATPEVEQNALNTEQHIPVNPVVFFVP